MSDSKLSGLPEALYPVNAAHAFVYLTSDLLPGQQFKAKLSRIQGGGSFPAPSSSRKVYVSKGGSDAGADGTPLNPFLTILAALNSITDACAIDADGNPKQYTVIIGQGTYTETADNLLRSGIFLQGEMDFQNGQHQGTELVQILTVDTNPVTGTVVNTTFPCTGAANLFFGTGIDLSASPVGSLNTCYLQDCNVAGNGIVNDGAISGVIFQLDNCVVSGATVNWGSISASATSFQGPIACTATRLGSTFIFLTDCSSPNATLALDTVASTSEYVVNLYSSYIGSITAANTGNSSFSQITTDTVSFPFDANVTIAPSITVHLINSAKNLWYVASNPTNWGGSGNFTVLQGLDAAAPIKNFIDKTSSYAIQTTDGQESNGDTMGACRVRITSASANNFTLPDSGTFVAPLGFEIVLEQGGAGQTTVVAGGATVIHSRGGARKIAGQYGVARLYQTDSNTWTLSGDITT